MARIKNKTKIGYWDNDFVEKTVEAVQNMNLTERVLNTVNFLLYLNKNYICYTCW